MVRHAARNRQPWEFLAYETGALRVELTLAGVDQTEIDRRIEAIFDSASKRLPPQECVD
jgi:hypothetical protein